MAVLVLSNDVVPGFGVPVAAPGLRSSGIAAGLRSHGFDVELAVPADVLRLAGADTESPPAGAVVIELPKLMGHIESSGIDWVVFTNANLTPHLRPTGDVRYVYDLFAPKMLERLASPTPEPEWDALTAQKERALALADLVWVNGKRKLGYALGWMMRPNVNEQRLKMGKSSIFEHDPSLQLQLVEMPVITPEGSPVVSASSNGDQRRIGIGGYAQLWSVLEQVHPAHTALSSAGHALHCLLPQHWSAGATPAPDSALPPETVIEYGPLMLNEFHEWVRSMDVMVDVFAQSSERRLAMITRSAVALGWGVPVIHGVDSEVSDIITEYDAGWVETSIDPARWRAIAEEVSDPAIIERKRAGAKAAQERFNPHIALTEAASRLRELA